MGNLHSLKRCNTYFENLIIYRLFIKIGNFDNYSVSFLYACILIYLKCLNEIWNRFEFDLNFTYRHVTEFYVCQSPFRNDRENSDSPPPLLPL